MTETINTAFVPDFTNSTTFASFVKTQARLNASNEGSRKDVLFSLAYAVAHGFIAAEGAAAAMWKTYVAAWNAKKADEIAAGTAVAKEPNGKSVTVEISKLHAAVRLASVKVGDTNAAVHFLTHFGARKEYASNSAVYAVEAVRKAAKMAEDKVPALMQEEDFLSIFADKAPQGDPETWKRLADSIKAELAGNATKGKKARQDIGDRAKQAQLLLTELVALLTPGITRAGQPRPAVQTSGTSDVDQTLQTSADKATEASASLATQTDPDAATQATIAKGQAAAESLKAETARLKADKARAAKAKKAAEKKATRNKVALETSVPSPLRATPDERQNEAAMLGTLSELGQVHLQAAE